MNKMLADTDVAAMLAAGPNDGKVIVGVKGIRNRRAYEAAGYRYWRL